MQRVVSVCLRGGRDAEQIEGAVLCAGGGGEDGGEAIAPEADDIAGEGGEITNNVVASLVADEARKRALLDRWVKGPFKSFAEGAYAMDGTAMRRALQSGETVYLAAVLHKRVGG